MNGDTTWTLCTETDGDRFVSGLLASSSAEAILMLSGNQPTRQYSIFLANTSHYWLTEVNCQQPWSKGLENIILYAFCPSRGKKTFI